MEMIDKEDLVNNPSHYISNNFEVIDIIESFGLGFKLGNCLKYIARAGKKDIDKKLEDLKKARWYLDRTIKQEEESQGLEVHNI